MNSIDCYDVLQLTRGVTADEIKKAYRRLALKYHPDLNRTDAKAEEKFKQINQAYVILGNPEKRKLYDRCGPAAFNRRAPWDDMSSHQAGRFGGKKCSGRGMHCSRKVRF